MDGTKERTRLVISRKLGQSVFIGDTKVKLEKTAGGGGYKFVIEATPDVRIRRAELVERELEA